tara:strand:+ start:532 stop:765 length:234 start_codon:yes stop_codon:yes gene_type:complete
MKEIEKPLTFVLIIAFTLLTYFFYGPPAQKEELIEELNQTKEVIEDVIKFEKSENDSIYKINEFRNEDQNSNNKEPY